MISIALYLIIYRSYSLINLSIFIIFKNFGIRQLYNFWESRVQGGFFSSLGSINPIIVDNVLGHINY